MIKAGGGQRAPEQHLGTCCSGGGAGAQSRVHALPLDLVHAEGKPLNLSEVTAVLAPCWALGSVLSLSVVHSAMEPAGVGLNYWQSCDLCLAPSPLLMPPLGRALSSGAEV